ncbi:MAG: NAD-dependent epimerase/dehydratase family protein [Elusimicrobia bacterium]|nr:NAD-dependent epimerase/dehydratase family protein [Elusimicrobiota bacterium]
MADVIAADAERILAQVDLSWLRGRTILVTGASGLIGGYVLACLKRFADAQPGAFEAVVVSRGPLPRHLASFTDSRGLRAVSGDLADDGFCAGLPAADCVIHAAGYGQPGRFLEDPVKTLRLNTAATFSLLEKLRPGGKFLFVSSSEVYSGLSRPPYKESQIGTTNTTHPRACYIEGKRAGEAICGAYRTRGVDAKSARLAHAYGPGTKAGDRRAVNAFIGKALDGKLTLLDRGEANRTYCYVSDAVEILWNVLLKGREPVYNVGGDSRVTIGDLARKIGKYLDVPVKFPERGQDMAGAPEDVSLDMSLVHEEFGARDYVPLDEGLSRTIDWQKLEFQGARRR